MQSETHYHQSEALAQARIDIARLEARFDAFECRMDALDEQFKQLGAELRSIGETLTEARGGWRALVWIGTSCASLGAGAAWVVDHLLKR